MGEDVDSTIGGQAGQSEEDEPEAAGDEALVEPNDEGRRDATAERMSVRRCRVPQQPRGRATGRADIAAIERARDVPGERKGAALIDQAEDEQEAGDPAERHLSPQRRPYLSGEVAERGYEHDQEQAPDEACRGAALFTVEAAIEGIDEGREHLGGEPRGWAVSSANGAQHHIHQQHEQQQYDGVRPEGERGKAQVQPVAGHCRSMRTPRRRVNPQARAGASGARRRRAPGAGCVLASA